MGAEPISSAAPSIDDDAFQGVPGLEPLPDEIPERDEGNPKPLIHVAGRRKPLQSHGAVEKFEGLFWRRGLGPGDRRFDSGRFFAFSFVCML